MIFFQLPANIFQMQLIFTTTTQSRCTHRLFLYVVETVEWSRHDHWHHPDDWQADVHVAAGHLWRVDDGHVAVNCYGNDGQVWYKHVDGTQSVDQSGKSNKR